MTGEDFRLTMFAIFTLPRWEDNGDGTATDVWHREAIKTFGTAEKDAAEKMREDSAKEADKSDTKIGEKIRKLKWEPDA